MQRTVGVCVRVMGVGSVKLSTEVQSNGRV